MRTIRQRITPCFLFLSVLAVAGVQSACAENGGDSSNQLADKQPQSETSGSQEARQTQSDAASGSAQATKVAASSENPNRPEGLSQRQESASKKEKEQAAAAKKAKQDAAAGDKKSADKNSQSDDKSTGGADAGSKPYEVNCEGKNCKAGQAVVTGYNKFHAHCHTCHGPDALGSSFAPSLVDALEDVGQGEFTAVVANGKKRFDSTTGTYKVMPAWSSNPDVMSNVGQLWAYLKARSDGALPAVRPAPIK